MRAAGGHSARHWDPIRLFCGSNHSILCGLVLGFFASWSVCHALQVKLMAVPIGSLLDGGVEEMFMRGSPNHQVKSKTFKMLWDPGQWNKGRVIFLLRALKLNVRIDGTETKRARGNFLFIHFLFLSPPIFTGNHELDISILVRINVKILGDFSAVSKVYPSQISAIS